MLNHRRNALCLVLCGFAASTLYPDPPENVNAWTAAPHGWHLDQLGPETRAVDVQDFGSVIYVSTESDGGDSADGSEAAPYPDLNTAMDRASTLPGQAGSAAIFVARGTYKDGTITMVPGVHLFGGFDPESWGRDIHLNPTVLDGGEKNRVLVGANQTTIDGFVITGGQVQGHGAGIFKRGQTS